MGCGKFPCLIIKAFYGLLQSPGKEGQNREVGEASGWKSDLQNSWGSVAVVSLQKQNSNRPFQESWRLWNWKLRCNSWSDLHGTGLLCPRLCTNHARDYAPTTAPLQWSTREDGWGLLRASSDGTSSTASRSPRKQAWWLQITVLPTHLLQSNRTKRPVFLVGLAETLSTKESGEKKKIKKLIKLWPKLYL